MSSPFDRTQLTGNAAPAPIPEHIRQALEGHDPAHSGRRDRFRTIVLGAVILTVAIGGMILLAGPSLF